MMHIKNNVKYILEDCEREFCVFLYGMNGF